MRFPKLKVVELSFVFMVVAAAAVVAQNSASPQKVVFSTSVYEAPAFYATYPIPDKDKDGVKYASEDIKLKSGGSTTLHNYTLSLHSDQDAFLVLYCDIPNTRGDTAALDQMLDGALAQLQNAKPGPKTDSTYGGLPARMVVATGTYKNGETTFNVTTYQRVSVQGGRVWQGIVVCDQRTSCSEADANRFLDSIKIR